MTSTPPQGARIRNRPSRCRVAVARPGEWVGISSRRITPPGRHNWGHRHAVGQGFGPWRGGTPDLRLATGCIASLPTYREPSRNRTCVCRASTDCYTVSATDSRQRRDSNPRFPFCRRERIQASPLSRAAPGDRTPPSSLPRTCAATITSTALGHEDSDLDSLVNSQVRYRYAIPESPATESNGVRCA